MNAPLSQRTISPELAPTFAALARRNGHSDAGGADLAGSLLDDACRLGVSDIHVEPHSEGARVRFRIDGVVRDIFHLGAHQSRVLINQFKALAGLDPIVRFTPRDAHARWQSRNGPVDLRLALAPTLDSDTLSVRLLDPKRLERSISSLGLSDANLKRLSEWLEDTAGMFIATGPTGSGKTTTLYALLHSLKLSNRVILSLEDPIEYQIDGISQIQIDELHEFQFSDGIRAVLRHDPDFLMVGEIRDAASAQTAVRAAIAGRALLTTMHSRDCVGAVTALRNWGLLDHEVAECLSVVVAQRLVRRLCVHCCERRGPGLEETVWFDSMGLPCPAKFWSSRGCSQCHQLGFQGRTGVFELWRLDESDCQMVLRGSDEQRLRAFLAEKGHRFLHMEALDLLEQGVTTFEEVRRVAAGTIVPGRTSPPPALETLPIPA